MSAELASHLIDDLGAMLLFTMLLILASGQLYRAIYAVAAQAVFLSIAGAILAAATGNVDLWVIAGITILVKAILLPWLLIQVIERIGIHREIEPVIPINVTLALAAAIVVLSFWLSASLGPVRQAITGNALPVGLALTLLGVLVMASRKKALNQMVGLFAAENGIFFTAMAVSQGMPLIIEIGVILDVVLGALVMGVMVLRVRSDVDTDISDLESLKG
jgi:hydrogenase-4 component E